MEKKFIENVVIVLDKLGLRKPLRPVLWFAYDTINLFRPFKNFKKTPPHTPSSSYKHLIVTQGFGHSGSGALLDLLCEFENVTAYGYHDINGSKYNKTSCGEMDFFRRYGGVLDLESAFYTKNQNIRDYKLKNFITLMEYYHVVHDAYNDKTLALTRRFIDSLIDFKLETDTGCDGNPAFMFRKGFMRDYKNLQTPFLFEHNKPRYTYYLKDLSVDAYRKLAKNYISAMLKTLGSKEFLVLDQFAADGDADFERLRKYIGNFKHIAVYRDPRDVYTTGLILNIRWIPANPDLFVKWYTYTLRSYLNKKHDDYMIIRFEDLVLNYEDTVSKIMEFTGLNTSQHKFKKQYFVPSVSIKNVGIYKKHPDQKAIAYIAKELNTYCYPS